jgi:hypothetical protein
MSYKWSENIMDKSKGVRHETSLCCCSLEVSTDEVHAFMP